MVYAVTLSLVLLLPLSSMAQDTCGNLNNYKDLIKCAQEKSPEIAKAQSLVEERKAQSEESSQFKNPELSVSSVQGESQGQKQSETDLSLAFPLQFGVRSAKADFSRAQVEKAQADLLKAQLDVQKEVTLKVIRLRQVKEELSLVKESYETFDKLVKQYESRPSRSPDQEVTLTVFKMARSDYSFKKVDFDEELQKLTSYFRVQLDLSLDQVEKALPTKLKKWPAVAAFTEGNTSVLLSQYQAELEMAKAELSKARAESFPELTLGPSLKISKDNGEEKQLWGLNLSMPLPVLSLNGGARKAATTAVHAAELRQELAKKSFKAEREALLKTYQSSVETLQVAPDTASLEEKHRKVENLFLRGLVPSSLIIEAHRSFVDFEQARNTREIKALEAFFDIQTLDGRSQELGL